MAQIKNALPQYRKQASKQASKWILAVFNKSVNLFNFLRHFEHSEESFEMLRLKPQHDVSWIAALASLVRNDKKKAFGFTLAEVLVTLTIIGVVAAMTLPGMIKNNQKQQTISQLKKVYTTLSQAVKLSEIDNGPTSDWNYQTSSDTFFQTYIQPYLSIAKQFQYGTISSSVIYYRLNGTKENAFTPLYNNAQVYILNDGTALFLGTVASVSTYKTICIDINGLSKPNTLGKDFFMYSINAYGVVPFGYKGSSDGNTYDTLDRNFLMKNLSQNYGCNKASRGVYCSALIMADGWQIKDDYPW